MDEVYVCQMCGYESTIEKDFKTDVDNCQDLEEMTCESCYDDMNN